MVGDQRDLMLALDMFPDLVGSHDHPSATNQAVVVLEGAVQLPAVFLLVILDGGNAMLRFQVSFVMMESPMGD